MNGTQSLTCERNLIEGTTSYLVTIPPTVVKNLNLEEGDSVELVIKSKSR